MKLRPWNFIKSNLFKKGTLLGLFTLSSAAGAQTIYQCQPCPNGLASQPGTISASGCFNPVSKSGSRVIFDNSSSGWSGTLQPGWYRISLRGSSGSGAGGGCGYSSCYGGNGGDMYYVFYVSSSASGEYSWNGGSPKFVVKENGKVRTFNSTRGTDGYQTKSNCRKVYSTYGDYLGEQCDYSCTNGTNGSSTVVYGSEKSNCHKVKTTYGSYDVCGYNVNESEKFTSNVDAKSYAGGKLTRL